MVIDLAFIVGEQVGLNYTVAHPVGIFGGREGSVKERYEKLVKMPIGAAQVGK